MFSLSSGDKTKADVSLELIFWVGIILSVCVYVCESEVDVRISFCSPQHSAFRDLSQFDERRTTEQRISYAICTTQSRQQSSVYLLFVI